MRDFDNHILINPIGCFLSFLDFAHETDPVSRQNKCLDWIKTQTLYQKTAQYSKILSDLGNGQNVHPSYSGCIQAFKAMGWSESPVFLPMRKAVRDLYSAHMIVPVKSAENEDETEIQFSGCGAELFEQGKCVEYLSSLSAIADYWRSSCFKIFQKDKNGIGSGFVVGNRHIATCRHVVSGASIASLVVEDENGGQFKVVDVRMHPESACDLALVEVEVPLGKRVLEIGQSPTLIDPVVIFGFPPVPHTTESILLCNRGEVSAVTSKLHRHVEGERGRLDHLYPEADNSFRPSVLILSSLLRPGNSGGPVLNRFGLAVGIVSKNLQEQLPQLGESGEGDLASVDLNKGLGYAAAISAEHLFPLLSYIEKSK